jgi:hypothetical protein
VCAGEAVKDSEAFQLMGQLSADTLLGDLSLLIQDLSDVRC